MKRKFSDRKLWLLLIVLILIMIGYSFLYSDSRARLSMIDVDPHFTGAAASSGNVISVTANGVEYPFALSHGDKYWLVPNGAAFNVSWTANSDLLGLAPVQSGISGFTAGTDGLVNHPLIAVCYTVQDRRRE